MAAEELDIGAVDFEAALGTLLEVLFTAERGEAPVFRNDYFLAAWKLILRAPKGLDGCCTVYYVGYMLLVIDSAAGVWGALRLSLVRTLRII